MYNDFIEHKLFIDQMENFRFRNLKVNDMDNLKRIETFISDRFRMNLTIYSLELNDNGDYRFKTKLERLGKFVIPLGFTVYAITPDYVMFTLSIVFYSNIYDNDR